MKKIIVTVGPSILNNDFLKNNHQDNYLYRVNGVHGSLKDIEIYVENIKKSIPNANILVDLPGNKVRTQNLKTEINLQKGQIFDLDLACLNYKDVYKYLEVGDSIFADDSTLEFVVQKIDKEKIKLLSIFEGVLKANKGFHKDGLSDNLPFLLDKDIKLIDLINTLQIDYIGLSFVRDVDDLSKAKKLINSNINIIAKIETKLAVSNLNQILQEVEYVLLDRGDLSAQVGISKIPFFQKMIIERALFYDKKIFLATQFLKNMETKPIPTIAEIIDLYNTFKQGVYGVQLSEETAIGKYPRECLEFIRKVLKQIEFEV